MTWMNGRAQKGKEQRQGKGEKPKYEKKNAAKNIAMAQLICARYIETNCLLCGSSCKKKVPLCITCQSKVNKEHKCPVAYAATVQPCTISCCVLRKELPKN